MAAASIPSRSRAWSSPVTVAALAGAAVLLAVFVLIEARLAPHPLVPLGLFRHRALVVSGDGKVLAEVVETYLSGALP